MRSKAHLSSCHLARFSDLTAFHPLSWVLLTKSIMDSTSSLFNSLDKIKTII